MKKGSIFLVMVLSFVCAGNALALENLKKTVAVFEFQNDVYVDFISNDFNKDIVFSPNEDFVYYLEYSSDGEHKVYGVKIGTEETFFINTAEDFFIKTCEQNNTSYVITTKDGEIDSYHVFDLDGNKVQFIEKLEDIDDLKNVICY